MRSRYDCIESLIPNQRRKHLGVVQAARAKSGRNSKSLGSLGDRAYAPTSRAGISSNRGRVYRLMASISMPLQV